MSLFGQLAAKRNLSEGEAAPKSQRTSAGSSVAQPEQQSKEGKKKKRQAAGTQKEQDIEQEQKLQQIVLAISKLALGTAREVAVIKSCIIRVILIKKEKFPELITTAKNTTKEYSAAVKTLSPELKGSLGSPHIFVWDSLLRLFAKTTKQKGLTLEIPVFAKALGELEEVAAAQCRDSSLTGTEEELIQQKRNILSREVEVCIVKKCWNPALARIELCTSHNTQSEAAMEAMLRVMKKIAEGDEKQNQAPRGAMERRIQRWVDKVSGGKKDANMRDDE